VLVVVLITVLVINDPSCPVLPVGAAPNVYPRRVAENVPFDATTAALLIPIKYHV
jgi:hypothetical protein